MMDGWMDDGRINTLSDPLLYDDELRRTHGNNRIERRSINNKRQGEDIRCTRWFPRTAQCARLGGVRVVCVCVWSAGLAFHLPGGTTIVTEPSIDC